MRLLRLPSQRRVVERQLLERLLQRLVLVAVEGEQARVHHGLGVAVSRQRLIHAAAHGGNSIAHLHLAHVLQAGDQVAHRAHRQLRQRRLGRAARSHLFHQHLGAGGHHEHPVALLHGAVHHAHERHHAAVRIEVRIEDERAQGGVGVPDGRGNVVHHGLQQIVHALTRFAGREHRIVGGDGQALLDLLAHAVGLGRGKVYLVDKRDDVEVRVHGHHGVGHGLRLHALGGVHHEHGALARGEASAHLVGEVDVAGRIDEVELVGLTVVGRVVHAHGLAFDGDAALALDVHAVEQLGLHVAAGHRARELEDAVGQRRLAMVDVRDDGEVADEVRIGGHSLSFK